MSSLGRLLTNACDSVQIGPSVTVAVFGRLRQPVYLRTRAGFPSFNSGGIFSIHTHQMRTKNSEKQFGIQQTTPISLFSSISPSSHPELIMCNN
jgi:hypothetical protein